MTVKNLITRLLDEPMDAEIMLQTDYNNPVESHSTGCVRSVTSGVVFDIDYVERWANRILINFTDWRKETECKL